MRLPLYAGVTRKSGGRPVWTGKLHFSEAAVDLPLKWKKPRKIFVNSMSDLFQDGVAPEFITRIWQTMERADWHVYQVLTKRPDAMLRVVSELRLPILRNVWLGTSVESHEYAERIAILRKIPAFVRFISFEPLLGKVGEVNLESIDWAIVGGESGPHARPMQTAWVDEIKRQCRKSGTAFFFKQWGGTNKKAAGRVFRGRTWDEYPSNATSQADEGAVRGLT